MTRFELSIPKGESLPQYIVDIAHMQDAAYIVHSLIAHLQPFDIEMNCSGNKHWRCYFEFMLALPIKPSDETALWRALDGFCEGIDLAGLDWDFTNDDFVIPYPSGRSAGNPALQKLAFNIKWQADY